MIGIYCIKNKINGKCYIGSTNNLAYRKSMHFHKLKFNRHVNSHLQNSYNKYGVDSFEFSIIEIITKDKFNKEYLLIREQHYIDSLHPEYNILQIAGSNLGYNHSDETKLQISSTMSGVKKSEEHAKHIRESQKGKILTDDHKKKLSDAAKKRKKPSHTTRISIDGIEYDSLKEASEKLEIKYHTIQKRLKNDKFPTYIYII